MFGGGTHRWLAPGFRHSCAVSAAARKASAIDGSKFIWIFLQCYLQARGRDRSRRGGPKASEHDANPLVWPSSGRSLEVAASGEEENRSGLKAARNDG